MTMKTPTPTLRGLSIAARTRGTRFFVLADAHQVGYYRLWDRWTMRPVAAPAHKGQAAAEYEARRMNGQAA